MTQPEAPSILVCDPLPLEGLQSLYEEGYNVDLQFGIPQNVLAEKIRDYKAVIVRSETKITDQVLENPGGLQVIARAGAGVDNINVEAATKKGILVINTPGANTISATELTIGHLISVARHIPQACASVKEGKWRREDFVGTELYGKTLGVIGAGNIGQEVITRAVAMRMKIKVFDLDPSRVEQARQAGAEAVSLKELCSTSDFITLHVPLLEQTKHIIDRSVLAGFKEGSMLFNVARGGLVDEEALVEAINSGRLAGAALDVFETEPNVNPKILECDNIIVTPHLGASTIEAQAGVAYEAAIGIRDMLKGALPRGAVNLKGITSEAYKQMVPLFPVARSIATLALGLLGNQEIQRVRTSFFGEIKRFETKPLQVALEHRLTDSSGRQVVNLINYREFEGVGLQRGLPEMEIEECANGSFSAIKLSLISEGGEISVSGVDAHGPMVTEINGYPVSFPVTNQEMLICENEGGPGMIGRVGTYLGEWGVNIRGMSSATQPGGRYEMMVLTLDTGLTPEQIENFKKQIGGILSVGQYKV